mmetsp:Transcript_23191/g.37281  ORF Transcript_23191/g.37281 Transcript_23191/m.37281 type:complete len:87 (-) Transcript_23191:401-661(-)
MSRHDHKRSCSAEPFATAATAIESVEVMSGKVDVVGGGEVWGAAEEDRELAAMALLVEDCGVWMLAVVVVVVVVVVDTHGVVLPVQ